MPVVLERPQQSERHDVANVQIGFIGIDAEFDPKRSSGAYGLLEFIASDDLGGAIAYKRYQGIIPALFHRIYGETIA